MEEKKILQDAIDKIDIICERIIKKENYLTEMPTCVQAVNHACLIILENNQADIEIVPLLEDMMYGMTQQDEVFLLDVLRFGVKEKIKINLDLDKEDNKPEGIYE